MVHVEAVRVLLAVPGIDVQRKDSSDTTTLMHAALCGCSAVAIAQMLLDKGADVNQVKESRWTALMSAVFCSDNSVDFVLM
jgi:ankyrin repeat protein